MALTKAHNRMIDGASFNILDFGAIGDGVTDDTAAIQAALDAAYATGNYATVLVPPSPSGNEYIFTQLLVKSRTTFKGTGGQLKLRDNVCVDSGTSYYPINNLGHDRVIYDSLFVIGNRSGGNTSFTVADTITAVGFRTVVKNCILYDAPDSGIMFSDCTRGACLNNYIEGASDVGIYSNGSVGSAYQSSVISGNIIKSAGVTGIALKREIRGVVIDGNTITDCPNAISHEDFGVGFGGHPSDVTISNNQIFNANGNTAITLNRLTNSVVTGNNITGTSNTGISVAGGVNSIISGNFIQGNGSETSSFAGIGVNSRTDTGNASVTRSDRMTITGNSVSNYLGKGIWILSCDNTAVTGNIFNVGGEALRLEAGSTNTVAQSNFIDGAADLVLYSGATYLLKNSILGGVLADGHRSIAAAQPLPTSVSSTVTANYIGEEVLHLAANTWFKAYGTGLQEWSQLN